MSVYGHAEHGAEHYLTRGWWPIPIHGQDDEGRWIDTGKTHPITGATGRGGTVTDDKVAEWIARVPDWNLGVRHQGTVAIDVDHDYGDKRGADHLADWAKALRLPPLPATWSSTARGAETPSRQHFYRVPEGLELNSQPVPDVEVCQFHHRFSVVWPSIHPSLGQPYRWYGPGGKGTPPTPGRLADTPGARYLPWLPKEWAQALARRPRERANIAEGDLLDHDSLIATFVDGPATFQVLNAMSKATDPDFHMGHDATLKALYHAFRLGLEGHAGVPQLIELITTRHRLYLDEARPHVTKVELYGKDYGRNNGLLATCARAAQMNAPQPQGASA